MISPPCTCQTRPLSVFCALKSRHKSSAPSTASLSPLYGTIFSESGKVKPKNGRHGDRLQLLYPLLYGTHIDALLQDNEEELDCYLWFDKPWRMPAVKAWAAILRLATSSEGIGTGMFLADLKALIDAFAAPDGITAHELDARAEGVLKVCDQFTSVATSRTSFGPVFALKRSGPWRHAATKSATPMDKPTIG